MQKNLDAVLKKLPRQLREKE